MLELKDLLEKRKELDLKLKMHAASMGGNTRSKKEKKVTKTDSEKPDEILYELTDKAIAMADKIMKAKGVQEMMSNPIMSSVASKPKEEPQSQPQTPVAEPAKEAPKESKKDTEEKKVSVKKKDPLVTKISSGSETPLKVKDGAADILAKIANHQKKWEKFEKLKGKKDKKYRKELDDQKERFLEETVEALTGKKPSVVGRMMRKAKRSGFMKYGIMAAGAVGTFFLAEKALANVDWKSIIPGFGGGENQTYTQDEAGARTSAEKYLGRSMSNTEWDQLIRATSAEAGPTSNKDEQARIMATILNRARDSNSTITEELEKPNQFQAVTGTKYKKGPSEQYTKGPNEERKQDIISSAATILQDVPKTQKRFAAADINAYGPGTNPAARDTLNGGQSGGTLFEVPMPEKRSNSNKISHEFGEKRFGETHKGADISGQTGDAVVATDSGQVIRADYSNTYGNVVYVAHSDGKETRYAHLSKFDVAKGDNIQKGQKLGEVGSTGKSDGPHLHYEVLQNGKAINPRSNLDLWPVVSKMQVEGKDSQVGAMPKKPTNAGGTKVSVLNNNTNVMNSGTTYQISQSNPKQNSQLFDKQYG